MQSIDFISNSARIFSLDVSNDIIYKYMPYLQRASTCMQVAFEFDISFDDIKFNDDAKKIIQLFVDQPKLYTPMKFIDTPFINYLAAYKFMNLYVMPEEDEYIRYAKEFMYLIMSRLVNFCHQLYNLEHHNRITIYYDSDLDDMLTHKYGSYINSVHLYNSSFLNFTQGSSITVEEASEEIYKAYIKMFKMGYEMHELVDRIGQNFYTNYIDDRPKFSLMDKYKPSGYTII